MGNRSRSAENLCESVNNPESSCVFEDSGVYWWHKTGRESRCNRHPKRKGVWIMAFFNDLSKKAKDVAFVASEKAKDAAELAKINVAIAGEQREIDKNYRTIGEWFVTEYSGEIPEAVKDLVDDVAASKQRIAELEASKPKKDADPVDTDIDASMKSCPVCGAVSDSKFCPQCGAPMGE